MFTDSHCHISAKSYEDIEQILDNARKKGIVKIINNGCDPETNKEVIELSEKFKNIYPALGIHPEYSQMITEDDLKYIEDHVNQIVAIGEIGLDYHYENSDKESQIILFEKQIEIAERYDKPIIVHTREALEDTIKILKKHPKARGVIHCFTGSYETASIFIKMGYKLGLGGVTTFKNAKIKDVIKKLPDSSFILETDSPYLAPEPLRGTKNEPQNIFYIASFVAKERGINIEELSKITEENVHAVFDI